MLNIHQQIYLNQYVLSIVVNNACIAFAMHLHLYDHFYDVATTGSNVYCLSDLLCDVQQAIQISKVYIHVFLKTVK